jgi:hypothetical protein
MTTVGIGVRNIVEICAASRSDWKLTERIDRFWSRRGFGWLLVERRSALRESVFFTATAEQAVMADAHEVPR